MFVFPSTVKHLQLHYSVITNVCFCINMHLPDKAKCNLCISKCVQATFIFWRLTLVFCVLSQVAEVSEGQCVLCLQFSTELPSHGFNGITRPYEQTAGFSS